MPPKHARSPQATPGPVAVADPPPARRLSPEQRRAQILEVVADLFRQQDYGDITVASVADAAGITQGLVYHYFDTRTGLLAAAVEAHCDSLLLACLPDVDQPIPLQFEQGLRSYIDYVEAHRVAYLNLFRGPAAHEPEFNAIIERTRLAIIEHVVMVLQVADAPIPVTRLSLRGYIGFVEAAILHWLEDDSAPRAALERIIFSVIIAALSAGLGNEAQPPLSTSELVEFERAYRAHFAL